MTEKFVKFALTVVAISPLLLSSLPASASIPTRHSTATAQRAKSNLKAGVATTSSRTTISSNFNKYSTATAPILKIGSRGKSVKDVQAFLQRDKLYTGSIDGVFGRQLRSAVMAFQRSQSLEADGIVGQRTWQALSKSRLG